MLKRIVMLGVAIILVLTVAASPGSAQEDDGDGGDALEENVIETTSCPVGVLSDDGQYCIVPRLDVTPVPANAGTSSTAPAGDTAAPRPAFTG